MKKFSRIYIEITNVCNLSCSFCIGNVRPARFMSTTEFASLLQQVKPFTDYIYLHVLGEPLLHPELSEMLSLAHGAQIKVNITTNGTLLANLQAMLLSSPALRKVGVSLHSMEGGINNNYLQQVAGFALKAAENGIITELRLWNLAAQEADNNEIFNRLINLFNLLPDTVEKAKIKINKGGCATLLPKIFLGAAPRFEWPSMSAQRTNMPVFCFGLRNHAAILCDGTTVPCCLDSCGDIALGNAFTTPLSEILASEQAQKLYEGFSNRQPTHELCRRCGYATKF